MQKLSKGTVYIECHNSKYYVFEWVDNYRKPKTLYQGGYESATQFYSSMTGRVWSKLVV